MSVSATPGLAVTMVPYANQTRLATAPWQVYGPYGEPVSTFGTTTQGLQEAINYAQQYGYVLWVLGGGVTPPAYGSNAYTQINCTSPISFPTGRGNAYHFIGAQLQYGATGTTPSSDFITFDTADFTEVDFHSSEIIYTGTGAAVRFNPQHDNGESFAGFTSSHFNLGNIALVDPTTLAPHSTAGIGVRVSVPALGLGLSSGNGIFSNNEIGIREINGGLVGIQIDNPGGSGSTFQDNRITSPAIHDQGSSSVQVGTATPAPNLIFGNTWTLNVDPATGGNGITTYGGGASVGDIYIANIVGGNIGLVTESTSTNNIFIIPNNNAMTKIANFATAFTNRLYTSGPTTRSVISVGSSPFVFTNTTMLTTTIFISGLSISSVALSADGSTYDNTGAPATNSVWSLPPGGYLRITYTGSVFMAQYY